MPAESSTGTFDPRTWALVVASFSLLFSLFNFFWTNKIRKDSEERDKNIREATVQREQFCEHLQRPINRVLEDLEALSERFAAIASSGRISSVDDVAEVNTEFAASHSRLRMRLRKADQSQFANGSDWDSLTLEEFETAAGKLNAAYNTTLSDAEKCASLKDVAEHIDQMCSTVRGRLEEEISIRLL